MKTFTILIILVGFLLQSNVICRAQTDDSLSKGGQLVGLSLNSSWDGHYGLIGNVGVRYGFFLMDRLAIGPELNYGFNGSNYKEFRPGAFIRYHFNSNKFSPFLETAYYRSLGWERAEKNSAWNSVNANDGRIGLGLRINNVIKDKISFETIGGYSTNRKAFYEFRFVLHF